MPKQPTKGTEPAVLTFANPDSANDYAPMSFRVTPEFRREFKVFASQHDMTMVELLQRSFQLMKSQTKR